MSGRLLLVIPTFLFMSQRTWGQETVELGPDSMPAFRLVLDSGKPAAGAIVRLIHQTQTYRELVEFELLHETTTDENGTFQLPAGKQVANAGADSGGFSASWVTLPGKEGRASARTWLLGTSAGAYSPYMEMIFAMGTDPSALQKLLQEKDQSQIPLKYTLPGAETELRVVNVDNSPATDVRVTPIRLVWLSKGQGRRAVFVPPQLRSSLTETTDSQGRVRFPTIARDEFSEIEFQSDKHGIQRTFSNNNSIGDKLVQPVMLFPTGSVIGSITAVTSEQKALREQQKLLFKSQVQNSGLRYPKGRTITMHGYAEVTVGPNGMFEIDSMVNGRMTLYDRQNEDASVRISFPERMLVRPNQQNRFTGEVVSTVLVRGIVRNRQTGKPIPKVAVAIRHGKDAGLSRHLTIYNTTDANGRFEARVFPGVIGYSPITVVPGLVTVYKWEQPQASAAARMHLPQGKRVDVPENQAEFELPTLDLVPSTTIKGRLIDGQGRALARTGVYAFPLEGRTNCDFANTNAAGEFAFDRVPSTHLPTFYKAGEQFKTKRVTIVSRDPLLLQMD